MTDSEIKEDIHALEDRFGAYRSKCLRNLRLFTYSPNISLDADDYNVVGFYNRGTFDIEDDTTSSIQINLIEGCISTLTAKIAAKKPRPFFNTVSGTYKDMCIVRNAQTFFDLLYEENNVYETVTKAFRNACIFDKGVVRIGEDGIKSILPYNVFYDPSEMEHGKLTHIAEKMPKISGRTVETDFGIKCDRKLKYTVYRWYDLLEHQQAVYVEELGKLKKSKWEPDELPYLFLFYTNPVKGSSSESIVDLLYGIQMQVDDLMSVLKNSIQMNPGMYILSPRDANVKLNMLSNRTGQIVEYDPVYASEGTIPLDFHTTQIIDPQWVQIFQALKNEAYERCGLSETSVTGSKPTGINSGRGLATLEEIESDRFEVQLNAVIRFYVDIAKRCMNVFPADEEILPESVNTSNITWGDLVESRNRMKIQFSAMSGLSKDPQTKGQQLDMLVNMGILPKSHVAQFFEVPDIQAGYNIVNNMFSAVNSFIERVIEEHAIPDEIPVYLPTDKGGLLESEIVNTMLSLSVKPEENAQDIELLKQLLLKIQQVQLNSQTNAEMMAVQQLSTELQQSMPDIQAQAQQAALDTMNQQFGGTQ